MQFCPICRVRCVAGGGNGKSAAMGLQCSRTVKVLIHEDAGIMRDVWMAELRDNGVRRASAGPGDKTPPGGGPDSPGTAVISKTRTKPKRPSLYRVLILNDDYTPMEFVVHVLEKFFNKDVETATKIMLHVHHHGIGECGIFTYEVAETKVTQVMDFARKHQHPLQCVMEKK
jgi:ATP-dependent Clp protease adaptor protein ClpS